MLLVIKLSSNKKIWSFTQVLYQGLHIKSCNKIELF